jgi:hypothetical protein
LEPLAERSRSESDCLLKLGRIGKGITRDEIHGARRQWATGHELE